MYFSFHKLCFQRPSYLSIVSQNYYFSNTRAPITAQFYHLRIISSRQSFQFHLTFRFPERRYARVVLARVTWQLAIAPLYGINEKLRAMNARHVTSICHVSDPLLPIHPATFTSFHFLVAYSPVSSSKFVIVAGNPSIAKKKKSEGGKGQSNGG